MFKGCSDAECHSQPGLAFLFVPWRAGRGAAKSKEVGAGQRHFEFFGTHWTSVIRVIHYQILHNTNKLYIFMYFVSMKHA